MSVERDSHAAGVPTPPAVSSGGFSVTVGALAALLALYLAETQGAITHETSFWLSTVGSLVYMGLESWQLKRRGEVRWAVTPPVLICAATFFLNFSGTNFVYALYGPSETHLTTYSIYDFYWMSRSMLLTNLGLIGMWAGYKFFAAGQAGVRLREWFSRQDFLRRDFTPVWSLVLGMFVLSVLVRLVAVSFGLYGYVGDLETKQALAAYLQYIRILSGLGTISLILVALYVFSRDEDISLAPYAILAVILAVEVFFGTLSGYKKEVVYPLITIGACYYIGRGKIPWRGVVAVAVMTVFAYSVIEPLRRVKTEQGTAQMKSVRSLSGTIWDIVTGEVQEGKMSVQEIGREVLNRKNKTIRCAVAVRAYDNGRLPGVRARFQRRMLMWPLYAVVPRLVWPNKPKQQLGAWFNKEVLGNRSENAVAMSPIAFMYIAGGGILIFGFMFLLGFGGRVLHEGFFHLGAGGVLVALGMVGMIAKLPDPVYAIPIKVVRYLPMLFVAQWIVYRK